MNVCQTKTHQEKGYANKLALLWGEAQFRLKKRIENTELPTQCLADLVRFSKIFGIGRQVVKL